ncbi:MAG: DUF3037 domain-containing protein [Pirellulales bacterium]
MQAHKGYYSLIQFCPDPGRAEVANIGVLVFCPDFDYLDVALSKNNRRVIEVFGGKSFDASWLNDAKKSFLTGIQSERERFKSLADLEQFVTSRGNELILTKPRAMRIEDAASALEALHAELVEPLRDDH